jgi:hypothetical protein
VIALTGMLSYLARIVKIRKHQPEPTEGTTANEQSAAPKNPFSQIKLASTPGSTTTVGGFTGLAAAQPLGGGLAAGKGSPAPSKPSAFSGFASPFAALGSSTTASSITPSRPFSGFSGFTTSSPFPTAGSDGNAGSNLFLSSPNNPVTSFFKGFGAAAAKPPAEGKGEDGEVSSRRSEPVAGKSVRRSTGPACVQDETVGDLEAEPNVTFDLPKGGFFTRAGEGVAPGAVTDSVCGVTVEGLQDAGYVPLTGEEEETCVLQMRAKLFKLDLKKRDPEDKSNGASEPARREWVESGTGPVKVLLRKAAGTLQARASAWSGIRRGV